MTYNTRLQNKILNFLMEATDGEDEDEKKSSPSMPRVYNKSGAYSKIAKDYNFQDAIRDARKAVRGDWEGRQGLDYSGRVPIGNPKPERLPRQKKFDPESPYYVADDEINSQIGKLKSLTPEELAAEEEFNNQLSAEKSEREAFHKSLLSKYGEPGQYEEEELDRQAREANARELKNRDTAFVKGLDPNLDLADKLVEYNLIVNELEKLVNSNDFDLKNLNNLAKPINDVDLANILPVTDITKNIDLYENAILLLAQMYIKVIELESLLIKKSAGSNAMSQQKSFEKKCEEVDKKLIELFKKTQDKIANKSAAKFPDLAQRITVLARSVDKIRNKENNALKERFFTYEVIAPGSQYWQGASGVKQALGPMLQEATWIQHLLRSNKLIDLKTITMDKFLETVDKVYGVSEGFKNSEYVTLEEKIADLQEKMSSAKNQPKTTKRKTSTSITNVPVEGLMNNPKYVELLQKRTEYDDEVKELQGILDTYDDDEAEMVGIDLSQIRQNLNYAKADFAKIQKGITDVELAFKKETQGATGVSKTANKKLETELQQAQDALSRAKKWNNQSYQSVKGKEGLQASPLEKFGKIKGNEFDPEFLYNKAQIADQTGRSVSPQFLKGMHAYYDYPDTAEEYHTLDPKTRYLQNLEGQEIGQDVDPMFIERLMNDNTSPYRNFNSMLLFDFFNKEKTKDYKEGVKNSITQWMQNKYNRKFGSTNSDLKFINKVSFYAFGLENTEYEPETGFIQQLPDSFIDQMMNKVMPKLIKSGLTPPGPMVAEEFANNPQAMLNLISEICAAATTVDDPNSKLELRKPGGSIAAAVFRNLYDENVVEYFQDFVDEIKDPKAKQYLEKAIQASEFYTEFEGTNTLVSPESYFGGEDDGGSDFSEEE